MGQVGTRQQDSRLPRPRDVVAGDRVAGTAGSQGPGPAGAVREAVAGWIGEMLREDLAAPRKQRHTTRRVFERLCDEHGAQVSYSYMAKYVARRRAEITAADRDGAEGLAGFVPQAREPGGRG